MKTAHVCPSRAGQLRRILASIPVLAVSAVAWFTVTAQVAAEQPGTDEPSPPGGAEVRHESAAEIARPMPLYAEPTRPDHTGRVMVAVEINGQGPFRFIVDTGANHSAVAPGVAERLALAPATGEMVEVHGVTGAAMLPAVRVDSLRVGNLSLPSTALPVLPGNIFGGADGILGITGLGQMRLDVDFVNDRVVIGPSAGARATGDFVTVRGSLWQGGLLLVRGRVGAIPVRVIVDTGAERTMGNLSLRSAILRNSAHDEELDATVHGATSDVDEGTYFNAPSISIGPMRLRHLPVTFADLHVFELWGLTKEPALVVGMDVLGTLERFIIDYKRKQFLMKVPGEKGTVLRRCTSSTCASRIPEQTE